VDSVSLNTGVLGGLAGGGGGFAVVGAPGEGGVPLDIRVTAPRMAFVDQKDERLEGRANFHVGGTFGRPIITGALDITGGDILFNGNRFRVLDGGVDFTNPEKTEPVFDVAAQTRLRVASASLGGSAPSQTFDITVRISGIWPRPTVTLFSDPYLSDAQILSLLFGASFDTRAADQQRLASSQVVQQGMIQSVGASVLVSALTERVGTLVERTLPVDTVQISPFIETADPLSSAATTSSGAGARITLSTRISSRATLTYTRTQSTVIQDDAVVLEYEQSELLSWILSRNEDRTFSLDFRIRHVF
jgi:hypothetical protein